MSIKHLDKAAKLVLAAGLDWWNSITLENMQGEQTNQPIMARLERDLELGKELFLELTGYNWYQDCPYATFIEDGKEDE
jgi:hypothetical protein